jgi:hypothetical protein
VYVYDDACCFPFSHALDWHSVAVRPRSPVFAPIARALHELSRRTDATAESISSMHENTFLLKTRKHIPLKDTKTHSS